MLLKSVLRVSSLHPQGATLNLTGIILTIMSNVYVILELDTRDWCEYYKLKLRFCWRIANF